MINKQRDENWVLSRDGSVIYVAGNDGILRVYDAQTGELLNEVEVGVDLGAIDISPDGTTLAIAESVARNEFDSPGGSDSDSRDVDLYLIDTDTLFVSRHTITVTAVTSTFGDVAFAGNGSIILTHLGNSYSNVSIFDVATETFTPAARETFTTGASLAGVLSSIPADETVLRYSPSATSLEIVNATGQVEHSLSGLQSTFGRANLLQLEASWGAGSDGFIAVRTSFDLFLLDGELNILASLKINDDPFQPLGVAFSADGSTLYAIGPGSEQVFAFSTTTFELVETLDLPRIFTTMPLRYGDEVILTNDGSAFLINSIDGLYRVAVGFVDTGLIQGTEDDDLLSGTDEDDIVEALGGTDTVIASPGVDTADGGDDFDTLRVWMDSNGYFPAFSGENTYILSGNRIYDLGGRIDTTFSSFEQISFSVVSYSAVTFDGSGYTPATEIDGFETVLSFGGSNSNVRATDYDDFVIIGGRGQVLDGGAGTDRLQFGGHTISKETLFITALDEAVYINQTIFGEERSSITARNFETLLVVANINESVDVITIDASGAPLGVEFRDGRTSDSFTGSIYADLFISAPLIQGAEDNRVDIYTGNGGADRYVFGAALDMADGTTITDFDSDDTLVFTSSVSAPNRATTFIGESGFSNAAGEYRYEKGGGQTLVQFDFDGDGIADATITLQNGELDLVEASGSPGSLMLLLPPIIEGAPGPDMLDGSQDDDIMYGYAGDDVLMGFAGNDTLDGGTGTDEMIGGLGNDTYFIDSIADIVTELPGQGTDRLNTTINLNPFGTRYANIEEFALIGSAIAIHTTDNGETIFANPTLGSRIFAYGGDDTINGSVGNDRIFAGSGNDTIFGGGGNDVIDGNAGADTMTGGAGNDNYFVDNLGDVVIEAANEGTDFVRSFVDFTLGDNIELLRIALNATVGNGNDLDNTIVTAGGAATLRGFDGNDNIRGSQFNDLIQGGRGNDVINGLSGVDTIEGGAGDDEIKGSNGDDIIDGGSGNDTIFGGRDNDTITGGAGFDTMRGDIGADIFVFDDGHFSGLTASTADRITDFDQAENDKIDLSLVDAILGGGDDAFTFIGSGAFSGTAGEVRFEQSGGVTMIFMDTNGNGNANLAIALTGLINLTEADFIL
ncbi:hypothetical protein [Erythrobacter sp. EC-HK427]|uniref:hypothetical protein n=1 Tax=Erythrobacter sp. EC-HK427 TaxID=2038396 RepID=UPI0030DCE794